MIQVTHRHMAGGQRHEHIAEVKWKNIGTGKTGSSSRASMVAWLDGAKSNQAFVQDAKGNKASIGTVHPTGAPAYIRTFADGKWTDNLLALDTY